MPPEEIKCPSCGSTRIKRIDGVLHCESCGTPLRNPNEKIKTKIKVDIYRDEAKIEDIKRQERLDRESEKGARWALIIIGSLFLLGFLLLFIIAPWHKVPVNSAADYKNKDVNVVVNSLRDAGFVNVSAVRLNDLAPKERVKENLVANVTVGGEDKWVEGIFNSKKEYGRFTPATVYYHSMNPDAVIDAPEGNGNVYAGMDHLALQQRLQGLGFSNIVLQPLGDLETSDDIKNGQTDHVTINGESEWSDGFLQQHRKQFRISDKVVIYYHSK